jgi:hypothetical protein
MRFRDQHAMSATDDALAFAQYHFDLTRVALVFGGDLDGLGRRRHVREVDESPLRLRNDLLTQHDDARVEFDPSVGCCAANQGCEVGTRLDFG